MSIPIVQVPITLDKPRTMVLGFNALCDVQRATGKNPFDEKEPIDLAAPLNLRAYLWAGLRHEDPALTIEDVGNMLDATPGGFVTALAAVAQALAAAMPDDVLEAATEAADGTEGKAPGSQ